MLVPRSTHDHADAANGASIPLFWRLFVPNACVLAAACVILIVEPANGRVIALVGGLAIMLAVNVALMRRSFAPLVRLTSMMETIDPLRPGQRVPPLGPASEVTVLTRAFNEMLDRIETERRDSARRAAATEESERRRLAAELHDEVGQTLTALVLQIERARSRADAPDTELAEALATAQSALDDVRRLARRLRPEVLDELGLVPALSALCSRLSQQTGLLIRRTLPASSPSLDPDGELVVYRIAQESLTNVIRHAGANEAHLSLRQDGSHVELTVVDDGVGLPEKVRRDGGVRGMRERAVLIGGELAWTRPERGGTAVRLRVPVRPGAP